MSQYDQEKLQNFGGLKSDASNGFMNEPVFEATNE